MPKSMFWLSAITAQPRLQVDVIRLIVPIIIATQQAFIPIITKLVLSQALKRPALWIIVLAKKR